MDDEASPEREIIVVSTSQYDSQMDHDLAEPLLDVDDS